ncbi:MAG TPA: hypothetical protein VH206_15965 [Xanthobacteraceae bacterium]|jgi:hypothetical protein|nr:hypothetical protein [Xanthobacteraceae bacterium]
MSGIKSELRGVDSHQRDLIVAYLSYALDDVQAVSPVGSQLLLLTIAAITEEAAARETRIAGATGVACH